MRPVSRLRCILASVLVATVAADEIVLSPIPVPVTLPEIPPMEEIDSGRVGPRDFSSSVAPADTSGSSETTAASGEAQGIDSTSVTPQESHAVGATVTIRANRHKHKEISKQTLTRAEYQKVAATAQDPLRALPTLPGVTTASDLSVRPIVRGGDESETSVELDGVPLIMPYHFGSVFSVFHREALEDFQLYTGVAPASAEGALSGTVLARSRSAPFDTVSGGIDLSALRGSAWIGIPLVKDRAGLWLSGQSFWYDFTLKRILDLAALTGAANQQDVDDYKATTSLPTNWDVQAGTSILLAPNLVLDAGGFVAGDSYRIRGTRTICTESGREVPCPESRVQWTYDTSGTYSATDTICAYHNLDGTSYNWKDCPENLVSRKGYDTSAIVDLSNWMASSRLRWTPSSALSIEATGAFQRVGWNVAFPGGIDHVLEDSASNRWRTIHRGDNSMFDWQRDALDLRLSSRVQWNESNETSVGLGWSQGREIVQTDLNRALANLILGSTGNPLDFLGFYNDASILEFRWDEPLDLGLESLERLDFQYASDRVASREEFWLEHRWDLDELTRVRIGLRIPMQDDHADIPNPRLHAQRKIGDADLVGIGLGLHTQSELPFQWRLAASSPLASEKVGIGVLEWEHTFAPGWRSTLSGWGKLYRDLASPNLVRAGEPDSSRMYEALETWLYQDPEHNGLKEIVDQLNAGYSNAPRWDPQLSDEENNRRYQRFNDSLSSWFQTSREALVPDAVRANLDRWLAPHELRYASTGEGWASGIEASLRYQPTRSWTGWASAEWSISRRQDRPGGGWYPFGSERPWKLSWVNAFQIDRGWELSLRYLAMAGNPYTPFRFGTRSDSTTPQDTVVWVGARNSARLAAYQRLDLRLSRSSTIFGFPATYYYEVWNAFNDPNMILRDSETGEFRWISMNIPIPVIFLGCEMRF